MTGVDTQERAIEFARFNAALNQRDVAFATCSPSHLEDELDAPVDLVTFVLPVLFPEYWRREASSHVSQVEPGVDGRELALGVYRQLTRTLRPGGRALLFHQVPLAPGDDLAAWLPATGADRLDTVANLFRGRDARFAYARVSAVRADGPGRLRIVRAPRHALGATQTRRDLARHLETARVLDGDLADALPRLYDWIRVTTTADVVDGAVLSPRAALDDVPISPDAWTIARSIDGRATVAEIQRRHPGIDASGVIRSLAERGLIFLER